MAFNSDTSSNWSTIWHFKTGNYVIIGNQQNIDVNDFYNYYVPSPYSYWYYHARIQYLYRAADLIASGAYPGNIIKFGWNIGNLYTSGPNGHDWGLKMKLTSEDAITNFDYAGWTEIFRPDSGTTYVPHLGWNMHSVETESGAFFWDGVSNIKIEACFSHPPNLGAANPAVYYTNKDYNCVGYRTDNSTLYPLCDTTETYGPTYRLTLPNMQLEFQILALMPPTLISPTNHALGVSTSPLFTWNPVETAATYQIQVAFTNDFLSPIIDEGGLTATSYQTTAILNQTTKYYWRAKAFNAGGEESYWSYTYDFITEGPIAAPVLTSPTNGLQYVPTLPVYKWEAVFAATQYNLEVATDAAFTNIVLNTTISNTTFIPLKLG